jgi:hypothetical protein
MSNRLTPEFIAYMKKWVLYDNALKKLNLQQKKLKENKELFENELLVLIKQNSLENLTLNIDNSKISLNSSSTNPSLTYKFLEESFNEYFNDHVESKNLTNFIKRKRENNKKTNYSLKRITNKNVLEKN